MSNNPKLISKIKIIFAIEFLNAYKTIKDFFLRIRVKKHCLILNISHISRISNEEAEILSKIIYSFKFMDPAHAGSKKKKKS